MRYQSKPGWCAAAAISNALRSTGKKIGQDTLAKMMPLGCEDGADENDVIRAIAILGHTPAPFETSCRKVARAWLRQLDTPAVFCVDRWGHWVCVAGRPPGNERVYLFDSTREPWNMCENGVHPIKFDSLLRRWRSVRSDRVHGGLYYAIEIH